VRISTHGNTRYKTWVQAVQLWKFWCYFISHNEFMSLELVYAGYSFCCVIVEPFLRLSELQETVPTCFYMVWLQSNIFYVYNSN